MTTRFASAYNAINLIRNGGLDFLKDSVSTPPYWEVVNATGGGVPPANSFTIIQGEDPVVEEGAANHFRFILANTEEVLLRQEFIERFIQPSFAKDIDAQYSGRDRTPTDWTQEAWNKAALGNRLTPSPVTSGCHTICSTLLTISMSLRIKRGAAKIILRAQPAYTTNVIDVVVYASQISEGWLRPSTLIDLRRMQLKSLSIVLVKIDRAGLCEIDVGAVQMSVGDLGDLPYTGDPAADAIPKGAIVFAIGMNCPTGYEKISFTPPKIAGRIFFKGGTPSMTMEGEETHDHETDQTMSPDMDWPTRDVIPTPFGESYGLTPDNAKASHEHEMGQAAHVPPTRDVILCKRL